MQKTVDEISVLKVLRNARDYFDAQPKSEVYNSKKTGFKDIETGYVFNSTEDFLNTLHEIGIQGKTLKEAGGELEEWYESLLQTQETTTEIPLYEAQTTTTGLDLETKIEQADKRAQQNADIRAREKQTIEDFIKQNEERIAKAKSLQEKLKDKVVYAKVVIPEEEKLTQDEQQKLETLKKYATDETLLKENGLTPKQILINDLAIKIEEILKPDLKNLTQEEKLIVAQTYAVKLVEEIAKPIGDYTIPIQTAILTAIPKEIDAGSKIIQKTIPEDPLIKQAKEGSMALELENRNSQFTTKEISRKIFGEKVASRVFGVNPEQIVVTFTDKLETSQTTYTVNFGALNKEYEQVLDRQNRFIGEIRSVGVENIQSLFINEGRTILRDKITKSAVGKFVSKDPILNAIFAQNVLGDRVVWQVVGQNRLAQLAVDVSPKIAGPVLGFFNKATPIITTAANQTAGKAVVGQVAAKTATKVGFFAKAVGWATKALGLSSGLATFGIGTAITLIGEQILKRINWHKIKQWFIDNKEMFVFAGAGVGLFFGGPVAGIVTGGLLMAATGTLGAFATGAFGVLGLIGRSVGIAIATPVIVTLLVLPPLVAFIMLVINNSAYVVPPTPVGKNIIHIPPGGNITKCDPEETGEDITEQLANSITSGSVQLLPDSVLSRQEGLCITPTMIVLHTSGGYDNDDGNIRTYETLVQSNASGDPDKAGSCQLATDTNDTILMLNFFEKKVEKAWCQNNLNAGGVGIEFAGECQGSGCAQVSKCSPNTNLTFTPNGPHPCAPEEDLGFDAVCKVMQKYGIPWTQVFQHEQSDGTHTDPVGDEWSDQFILRLKNNCTIKPNEDLR